MTAWDWLAMDVGDVWKALSALAGITMATLAVRQWLERRKLRAEARAKAEAARWAGKADLSEIEEVHERINRHKRDNQEQLAKNYNAVIDLYAKHEKTQQTLLAMVETSGKRHDTLLGHVIDISQRLPRAVK